MARITLIIALLLVVLTPAYALAGNGAPGGSHYNLNLLGKEHCPGDDMKGGNRHTIFVKLRFSDVNPNNVVGDFDAASLVLDKTNKIFLAQSFDGTFQVLDGNACDGDGAQFMLPANGTDGSFGLAYEVFVRELGKPGGTGQLTTCGITADNEVVCSTENVLLQRSTGKSTFRNVTKELTTLEVVIGGQTVTVSLFDDDFVQYLWDFDNNGLRLVQLRFYPLQ